MKKLTTLQLSLALAPAFAGTLACSSNQATTRTFATPEEAMREVATIAETGDIARAEGVFGPEGLELFESGDEAADREDGARIKSAIDARLTFADEGKNSKFALIGPDEWPFPIPLVADNGRWRFDLDAGRDELKTRRIGQNELMTLATLHECVSAQQEYFARGGEGKAPCYACRIASADGQHDGLYWSEPDGTATSPLGPMVAEAACDDSQSDKASTPYHGYHFRCLNCQGKHAPGGQLKYSDDHGLMTRGFAILAWPAKYGESGVMTFQISHRGIVYQKDLGAKTDSIVANIAAFDPDDGWETTRD